MGCCQQNAAAREPGSDKTAESSPPDGDVYGGERPVDDLPGPGASASKGVDGEQAQRGAEENLRAQAASIRQQFAPGAAAQPVAAAPPIAAPARQNRAEGAGGTPGAGLQSGGPRMTAASGADQDSVLPREVHIERTRGYPEAAGTERPPSTGRPRGREGADVGAGVGVGAGAGVGAAADNRAWDFDPARTLPTDPATLMDPKEVSKTTGPQFAKHLAEWESSGMQQIWDDRTQPEPWRPSRPNQDHEYLTDNEDARVNLDEFDSALGLR